MCHSQVTAALFLIPGFLALRVHAQDTAQPPAQPATPAPVVLDNSGKPMLLPFQCTDEDIHAGGLSCTEDEPCGVFLELTAAAASPGGRIFAAGNIHTEAVTLYSVLLSTSDGGQTWTEAYDRIRSAGLDHIQFAGPEKGLDKGLEKGWISGEELSPLPQNPFLLVTTDGGKTWTRRPILNDADENRFGTVHQFTFTADNVGSLIVDRGLGSDDSRYVLYESPNGGDHWQIRQESRKPLVLKAPPAVPSDWRIHVDAASKAFQVEKRQGDRWTPIASFLVRLNPCKPPKPPENGEEKPDPAKPPIKK
jgi:hypothetical protein